MNITPSKRIRNLPVNYFAALEARVAALQQDGCDVIRLDVGSPDMAPPAHIIEALQQSAETSSHHGYQPYNGTRALRQAWADHYQATYNVDLDPDKEILPLLGSKEGIFNLAMAWVDPGDAVLIPNPGYMTYTRGALFAGGTPYYLPLRPEHGYLPDLEAVPAEILKHTRLLWVNYPNNPTAAVASLHFYERLVAFAHRHNLLLCQDAAYNLITFDGYRAPSILEVPGAKEVAVEFNSLSKSHNMAGWRTGVIVGCSQAIQPLLKLKTNLDSGHFRPVLDASTAALNGDSGWMVERNRVYQERRDLVVARLHQLGVDVATPQASLYVWFPVPQGWTSMDFVTNVLEKVQVSLTPGTVFGNLGEGFVRISLTTETSHIAEAMQRLSDWRKFL